MRPERKRSGHFLCFGVTDSESEAKEMEKGERRRRSSSSVGEFPDDPEITKPRRRLHRRIFSKIIKSAAVVSSSSYRRGKLREVPDRSLARKTSNASDDRSASQSSRKSSDNDNRRPSAIFSSSSSSSSSSSCRLSSASSVSFPAPERKLSRKGTMTRSDSRKATPSPRNYNRATGFFCLLLSLSVMVFCGRLCAIIWTSSWLCFVPRRSLHARSPECHVTEAESRAPAEGSQRRRDEEARRRPRGSLAKKTDEFAKNNKIK